jgi:hypothetical protein
MRRGTMRREDHERIPSNKEGSRRRRLPDKEDGH